VQRAPKWPRQIARALAGWIQRWVGGGGGDAHGAGGQRRRRRRIDSHPRFLLWAVRPQAQPRYHAHRAVARRSSTLSVLIAHALIHRAQNASAALAMPSIRGRIRTSSA
jgi:hypothetical protein